MDRLSTDPQFREYVEWLGLDLPSEQHLLWIAARGYDLPLPRDWTTGTDSDGRLYYINTLTNYQTFLNPNDERTKLLLLLHRKSSPRVLQPPAGLTPSEQLALFEPTFDQLVKYSAELGLTLPQDQGLLAVAKKYLKMQLPEGWSSYYDDDLALIFRHDQTGFQTFFHPVDELARVQIQRLKTEGKRKSKVEGMTKLAYKGDYKPDVEELLGYAQHMGLQLPGEEHLLPLVEQGLTRPLPPHWACYLSKDQEMLYYNELTEELIDEHPCDQQLRDKIASIRKQSALIGRERPIREATQQSEVEERPQPQRRPSLLKPKRYEEESRSQQSLNVQEKSISLHSSVAKELVFQSQFQHTVGPVRRKLQAQSELSLAVRPGRSRRNQLIELQRLHGELERKSGLLRELRLLARRG